MNVREKTLLEIIAESAGKHPAESPEISVQPIKPKAVRAVSYARKQVCKPANMKSQPDHKHAAKKLDEYLKMAESMLS